MTDELVTIAEYMDSIQAEMAKQVLEDFGIRAIVIDQNAVNICLAPTVLTAKLQVFQHDADQAKQILEDNQQGYEPEDYEVMDDSADDEPYDPQEEKQ